MEIVGPKRRTNGEEPPLTNVGFTRLRVPGVRDALDGALRATTWGAGSELPFFFSSQGGVISFQIRVLTRRSISR